MAKLITKADMTKLIKNGEKAAKSPEFTCHPVVKIFGGSSCTWLIAWVEADLDRAYALCDLGMGMPELGYVSLRELSEMRFRPFRLPAERDRFFTAEHDITEYAKEARRQGRIVA
jgi:hypothetical protein